MVRDLDRPEWRLIPGTADAWRPFFSPDGKWVGFNAGDGTLRKVSLTGGGAPLTLCRGLTQSFGASWGPDDTIVFTPDNASGLWQVPASGGEPRELTKPDVASGEKSHRFPQYVPGGEAILFTAGTSRLSKWDDARIEALVLATGERRTVLEGGTTASYVDTGHLLYRRGNSILAVPFDLGRLATTGTPVTVVDGVHSVGGGAPHFTVARRGTLAYVPQARDAQRLVLVDRAGAARPLTPFFGFLAEPRVSPDGRSIAVRKGAANEQIWRFDLEREAFSQITFEWDNTAPVWTPDGEFLIASSTPGWTLHRVRADGSAASEVLSAARGAQQNPGSVAPDGKLLAYSANGTNTSGDIWLLPLEGGGEARVFLQTPAFESSPAISPDGRLLAYQSYESGRLEVYVRSFPGGGNKVQVSSAGGAHPVWARNGKELFYRVPLEDWKWRMMVVGVSAGNPVRFSRGRPVFEDSYGDFGLLSYDVLPDGQHFVMVEVDRKASQIDHFNVVLNWFEELRRLVPPK
jgi:serine/threonine-protein kinase